MPVRRQRGGSAGVSWWIRRICAPECAQTRHPSPLVYPIGYYAGVESAEIIGGARRAAGLSQDGLARLAGTSRTTLSAYEHGRKSPTLATAARIIAEAGFELSFEPRIRFVEHKVGRGRTVSVPTVLPRLRADAAFRMVSLPLHLNWSDPGRTVDLRDRRQRARLYERVIRDGTAGDVVAYIDGVLLSDLWPELVLPVAVRRAWEAALPVLAGGEGSR